MVTEEKVSMKEVRSFFRLPVAKPGRKSELVAIFEPQSDTVTLTNSQVRFLQKVYFLLKGKKITKAQIAKLNEVAAGYNMIFTLDNEGVKCEITK